MRYNKIRKMDISNGPGVRVSVFMQGCTFNCDNCFNKETHDFNGGLEFNSEIINEIIKLCENENIKGLSILGGEPMHPKNRKGTTMLAKEFKKRFPNKSLWLWTGFIYDKDLCNEEIMDYIDILIDGKYDDKLYDPKLKWRGSSNQRVIDIKESLKTGNVVIYKNI